MSVRVHPIGREAGRAIEAAGSRHDSVRAALEYYLAYADETKSPGFWVGAGAENSFGFVPGTPVAREAFVAVMTVRDPQTGELLSPRTKNLIRRDRRPGFDVVFRMERSAALAFVACPEARSAIRAAHEEAIRQSVSYFEAELLVAKSATDVTGRPMRTSGLATAGFHHYANRSGDPDLHTHVIVANLVRRTDGTWATFAAGKLMGAASTLSAIYHMVFFAEIERVFGAQIRRDSMTGYRRLAAVSDAAVAEFLRRTHEVDAYIEEMGWPDTEVARQAAVIATRRSKAEAELLADERSWRQRMAAVGVTKGSIREALNLADDGAPAPPEAAVLSPAELAGAELRVLVRLSTGASTRIYREQVVREWARELHGIAEVATLLSLVDHTMDEERGLLRRVAADRDNAALYVAAPIDVLRRRFGDQAVAEAATAERVAVAGRVPGTLDARTLDVGEEQAHANLQNPSARHVLRVVGTPAGYVVFEAPRSVALYVAAAPERTRAAQLEEAHRRAVAEVTGAILSATDRTETERRGPVLVEEAQWGTKGEARLATKVFLPGVDVYAWSQAAGALYRASLRAHACAVGISFEAVRDGFELSGTGELSLPDGRSLLDAMARRGSRPVFRTPTQGPLPATEGPEIPSTVWSRLGCPSTTPVAVPLGTATDTVLDPDGPLRSRALWTQAEFLAALDAALPQGCSTAGMLAAAWKLGDHPCVVSLDSGRMDHRDARAKSDEPAARTPGDPLARYALTSVLADEEAVLGLCEQSHPAVLPPRAVRRAIERVERARGVSLSAEQRRAVEEVLCDARAVSAIVGVPGAGKTTVVAAIAEGLVAAGHPVIGLAHTGVASDTLAREASIACSTIDSFLYRLDRGRLRLGPRSVVVVDEASQVDSARLVALAGEVHAAGAKLILLGDPRQQGAVEAGGLFAEIVHRRGASVLAVNRRQRSAHERQAVASLRQGFAEDALQIYLDHDQLRVTRSHAEMLQGAVDEHTAWRTRGPDAMLLARRRSDVAALNLLARQALIDAGLIDETRGVTIGDETPLRVASGDRLHMTAKRTVVTARPARTLRIGNLRFGAAKPCSILLGEGALTLSSSAGTSATSFFDLPRIRRPRSRELARLAGSGVAASTLSRIASFARLDAACVLRRGSVVEVTDVKDGLVFLRHRSLEVTLPATALEGAVEHAYAWPVATAQSQTVGTARPESGCAIVVGADELGPDEALVALTRARDSTTLWACTEDQATTTWSRRRIEAAETLVAAIETVAEADPTAGAFLSLACGVDQEPPEEAVAAASVGIAPDGLAALVESAMTALLAVPVVEATLARADGDPEHEPLDVARRIFAERARDPVVRMAQRWGAGAPSGGHAASTALRHRAEAERLAALLGVEGCRRLCATFEDDRLAAVLAERARCAPEEMIQSLIQRAARAEAELAAAQRSLAEREATAALLALSGRVSVSARDRAIARGRVAEAQKGGFGLERGVGTTAGSASA
ncbi:MAG: relaxase domain-containing protein [Actinomycetota bacterium]|nr:relaxase domain-containing protein [Actinomycetota bacterium]